MKTTNGGLVFIRSNTNTIAENYSLSQNYPNPFNSSTVIKYELPKYSNVIIKIYDTQGKQIYQLVNEKQDKGSYELLFNASEIPTGVYFYSLFLSGPLISTKKLFYIK